jgi:NADPH2:quinone reductase
MGNTSKVRIMKAVRIHRYGGPEVLQREDIPVPVPLTGEALVKVAYAGINFMDVHTRQGKYETSRTYPVRLPLTLGMEGSGVIEAVGPGVRRVKVGDRVAWCISWGSYADFTAVPEERLAVLPDDVDLDLAAAATFQGSTAHYLTHDVAQLGSGSTCLVHAASGGIGQLLVQFAKRLGATVFATTSTEEKADIPRRLGADHVQQYGGGRFADVIREHTDGKGVDVVFDAVGRPTLRDSFRAARTRGLVINYGSVAGSLNDLDPIELGEAGSLFLTRPRLADYLSDAETVQRRADDVFRGMRDGSIAMEINERFSFNEVEQAHAALEERRQIGKSVLSLET